MTRVVADNLGPANSGGERRLAKTVAMQGGHAGPRSASVSADDAN